MEIPDLWPAADRRGRWTRLLELLDPRPGEQILDVGFGGGQALRFIADRVGSSGRAAGVERNPGAVEALNTWGDASGVRAIEAITADAQELPFPEDSFDAVLTVNVLEAVPDRPRALAEMRRVLKPGGRILVAHDDYESIVYACSDRELCRRVVRAFADVTFKSYPTSDGQMGRHLWGLFRNAGFRDANVQVVPLVNTEYRDPLHGWETSRFSAQLVAAVSDLTQEELDRWRADLAERSARDEYLYCITLYVCQGQK
jgi:arsenite methyltransferase